MSKRSRILKEVLEFINRGDCGYWDDFWVFGETAFLDVYGGPDQSPPHTRGDDETFREISAEATRVRGSRLSWEKTRVDSRRNLPHGNTKISRLIRKLTPKTLENLLEKMREVQHPGVGLDALDAPSDDEIDALDAHYSEEILQ